MPLILTVSFRITAQRYAALLASGDNGVFFKMVVLLVVANTAGWVSK